MCIRDRYYPQNMKKSHFLKSVCVWRMRTHVCVCGGKAVSYTHLDVYKRQLLGTLLPALITRMFSTVEIQWLICQSNNTYIRHNWSMITSLSPRNSTSKLRWGNRSLLIRICGTLFGIEPETKQYKIMHFTSMFQKEMEVWRWWKKIVFEIRADSDCTTLKTWRKAIFRKVGVYNCLYGEQ